MTVFEGYTNAADTEKKILRNLFKDGPKEQCGKLIIKIDSVLGIK